MEDQVMAQTDGGFETLGDESICKQVLQQHRRSNAVWLDVGTRRGIEVGDDEIVSSIDEGEGWQGNRKWVALSRTRKEEMVHNWLQSIEEEEG